jgi:hypothetical protein
MCRREGRARQNRTYVCRWSTHKAQPTNRIDEKGGAVIAHRAQDFESDHHEARVQHWPCEFDVAEVAGALRSIARACFAVEHALGRAHPQIHQPTLTRHSVLIRSGRVRHFAH